MHDYEKFRPDETRKTMPGVVSSQTEKSAGSNPNSTTTNINVHLRAGPHVYWAYALGLAWWLVVLLVPAYILLYIALPWHKKHFPDEASSPGGVAHHGKGYLP